MAEKGGKGFSLPKSGKSSLKSPASKGKDDSSASPKEEGKFSLILKDRLIPIPQNQMEKLIYHLSKVIWAKPGKERKLAVLVKVKKQKHLIPWS